MTLKFKTVRFITVSFLIVIVLIFTQELIINIKIKTNYEGIKSVLQMKRTWSTSLMTKEDKEYLGKVKISWYYYKKQEMLIQFQGKTLSLSEMLSFKMPKFSYFSSVNKRNMEIALVIIEILEYDPRNFYISKDGRTAYYKSDKVLSEYFSRDNCIYNNVWVKTQ